MYLLENKREQNTTIVKKLAADLLFHFITKLGVVNFVLEISGIYNL